MNRSNYLSSINASNARFQGFCSVECSGTAYDHVPESNYTQNSEIEIRHEHLRVKEIERTNEYSINLGR